MPGPRLRLVPARVLLCLAATGAAGCSAPPEKERNQAEGAIAAARVAEAADYAPAELEAAVAAIKAYDQAVAAGDYRLALNEALSARDTAYQAAKLAGDRKAAARGEAERLIVDLEGLLIVARSRLAGTPPTLSPQAAARTRVAVKRAPGLLQEARARLDRQDFRGVTKLLQGPVQALRKDLAPGSAGRRESEA